MSLKKKYKKHLTMWGFFSCAVLGLIGFVALAANQIGASLIITALIPAAIYYHSLRRLSEL